MLLLGGTPAASAAQPISRSTGGTRRWSPLFAKEICSSHARLQAVAGIGTINTNLGAGEPAKTLLIGEATPHEIAGDSKTDEITPVKFVAEKSGTVEELCYETGGYLFHLAETSLVLGIEEDVSGLPGKVLGEGTYNGRLAINKVARVTGLKVPITAGKVYFLDFLPLGGAVTYWYRKTEPVIYSVNHKKLVEDLPEEYEWIEEAEAAPIGIWANGT